MARWISEDGRVEIAELGSGNVDIKLDGRPMLGYLRPQSSGWVGAWGHKDNRDAVVITKIDGRLLVAHAWMRPWAEGTDAEPRTGSEEWWCDRVLESEADDA